MNTHANQTKSIDHQAPRMDGFVLRQVALLVLALSFPPVAMAQESSSDLNSSTSTGECGSSTLAPETPSVQTVVKARRPGKPDMGVKIAAESILSTMMSMQSKKARLYSVKVPSFNYLAILQELQNRNARFLLPGAEVPDSARFVFQLESEQVGLSQTVYFL